MLILNRRFIFSSVLRRRLIHAAGVDNFLVEQDIDSLKNRQFEPEKLINFSNSSIKPFLNLEKIEVLKEFYQVENDMKCTYNFVIDENVAEDIVSKIITNDEVKNEIIVEGNPGLGLITLNLIKSGVPHIFVFDQATMQDIVLNQLIDSHPEKITKKLSNMHKNPDCVLLRPLDVGQQHGVPVTIIGVSTSYYFLRGLAISFVKYNLWHSQFKTFLVLSKKIVKGVSGYQKHFKFPVSCVFNLFFNMEEIATYPREAFLPFCKQDNEDMNLIKVTINQNAFEMIQVEEISDYFAFLKIIGTTVTNFVIPTLEKWLPNCGPYLISKGISVTTQARDLSPEETIRLFHFCKECDGYSHFKSSTLQMFQKAN